jgi:hypothetical protein
MSTYEAWTFVQSLEFVRKLETVLDPLGFHTGLTGSVLQEGKSSNDLDIIVYPHNSGRVNFDPIHQALKDMGLQLLADHTQVARVWIRKGSFDTKCVEAWKTEKGQKVDLFYLR